MASLDLDGNLLWHKVIEPLTADEFYYLGSSMVRCKDHLYTVSDVGPNDNFHVRVHKFDFEGHVVAHHDFVLAEDRDFDAEALIATDDKLLMIGVIRSNAQPFAAYIMELDTALQQQGFHTFGDSILWKRFPVALLPRAKGGYYFAVQEKVIPNAFLHEVLIHSLDENFQIKHSNKLFRTNDFGRRITMVEADDGGCIMSWQRDTFGLFAPHPTTIYKLDTLLQPVWDYTFYFQSQMSYQNKMFLDRHGRIVGIGFTDHFATYPDYDIRYFNGWCFRMSQTGDLLWQRFILDRNYSEEGGAFWSGLETEDGYVMVGNQYIRNPSNSNRSSDQNIWLFTIDSMGCWNGGCDEDLVILNDSTTLTSQEPTLASPLLQVYPNPTQGSLIIIWDEIPRPHEMSILDAQGKVLHQQNLRFAKSTLNLSHLPPGIYLVQIKDEHGQKVHLQKIIKQ